jgi:glycosyltransferase involved in cell wall biosynthesis
MKVGLDFISESSNSAGSMTYGLNILRSLSAQYPKSEFTVFVNRECNKQFNVSNNNVKYIITDWPANKSATSRRLAQQVWLPRIAATHNLDLLHSINNVVPFTYRGKKVVSILDMTSFTTSGRFSNIKRTFLKSLVPTSAKNADAIITISNYSKGLIQKICGVPEGKITVSYCGVNNDYFEGKAEEDCPELPDEFILFVGTIEPGKNLVRLISSFSKLYQRYPGLCLVIVGRKGWLYDPVFEEVNSNGLDKKVIFTGRLSLGQLIKAYHKAKLFVFPSLDEGFGIPVLEAMAAGCPVVTSDISALPEISGGNAILCDPYDIEDIADKMALIIDNKVDVLDMKAKGIKWAGKFSWDKTAISIYGVYNSISK